MNILLVDDDRYIIKALEEKIDWHVLGAIRIFTAYNMRKAQEVIKSETIDLLISDIEMPQGSGLQLLSWIRQEGYEIQTIFLTNYADFNYAQKAIELQSFEYYLKPIEFDKLALIIKKALKKIKDRRLQRSVKEDFSMIESAFWHRYLRKPRYSDASSLLKYAAEQSLPVSQDTALISFIFSLHLTAEDITIAEQSWSQLFFELLKDVLTNFPELQLASLFKIENRFETYLTLFRISSSFSDTQLKEFNKQLALRLEKPFQRITSGPTTAEIILENTQVLYDFCENYVGHDTHLYILHNELSELPDYHKLPLDLEKLMLNTDEKLTAELIQNMLLTYERYGLIKMNVLKSLRLDFLQKIDIYLDKKEILAHKLFQNSQHEFLSQRCYNSIEAFRDYLIYYIKTAQDYIRLAESNQSLANILVNYIDQHYAEEINRKTLSEIVFLSPDHLARLFKKETGETLINYITGKRIDKAKELLHYTEAPVYLIASQVGYDNYSYFSKIFKKETGFTPLDYRNKND